MKYFLVFVLGSVAVAVITFLLLWHGKPDCLDSSKERAKSALSKELSVHVSNRFQIEVHQAYAMLSKIITVHSISGPQMTFDTESTRYIHYSIQACGKRREYTAQYSCKGGLSEAFDPDFACVFIKRDGVRK